MSRVQPVPFSHQHHVGGLGIDCRYCHTSVETSSFAGIPPTKTCMNCHAQIWTNAPMLEPVRESFRSGTVDGVDARQRSCPTYVYFDHSIHINKGVGCNDCHGPVDRMPLMYAARHAANGVVPELPSRAGKVPAAARRSSTCATSSRPRKRRWRWTGRNSRTRLLWGLPEEEVPPA